MLTCPECGADMVLRVTKRSRTGIPVGRKFYGCSRWPECDGTHGAHPDGTPLGIPANKETKAARIRAHDAFDQLFKQRGRMSRSQAYTWLRKRMKLSEHECHIGRFDIAQCERVVELCLQRLQRGFKHG